KRETGKGKRETGEGRGETGDGRGERGEVALRISGSRVAAGPQTGTLSRLPFPVFPLSSPLSPLPSPVYPRYGYRQSTGGLPTSLIVRGDTQRYRLRMLPALSLVPDARPPPNGCCPTTAPVHLSLT